jgi:hypothetical protein
MIIDTSKWKSITEAKEAFVVAKQKCLNAENDSCSEMDASDDMENVLWWVLENYETDSGALLWVFNNTEDDSPILDALLEKMGENNISFF